MKSLATATIVIIILAVLTMGFLGFFFMKGFHTSENQITREKAIAQCQSWCAEDQQKIYQLSGHPGVLDLPSTQAGIMYLKPTSFCKAKLNVKGYGEVWCDQLTTCRVTDGDGDSGYLHCASSLTVNQGSGGSGSGTGGGGGGTINIEGPLAQGVPLGEKVLQCDHEGNYIKFYANDTHPLARSKIKVWGIVCHDDTPVINQKVFLMWNDEPLADTLYRQTFDDINENNTHNLEVLKGWDLSDNFYVKDSTGHCGGTVESCTNWFWNNIRQSGAILSFGYFSPYCAHMYKHEHGYPMPMVMLNYYNVTPEAQDSDEVDMRITASAGPRYYSKGGKDYLTLAGTVTEVVFELSNGTNITYVHYIHPSSGCHPGEVYNCYLNDVVWNIPQENCTQLLNATYHKLGIFEDINWSNSRIYRNVTIPKNDERHIYVFKGFSWSTPARFPFRADSGLNRNWTLKKVMFIQGSVGVGGCGGAGISVDDFRILKYKNVTRTNQFGMFSTIVEAPTLTGKYKLKAQEMVPNGAIGEINITSEPYIVVNFATKEDEGNLTIFGNVTDVNETPIKNAAIWLLIDGEPYSNKKDIIKYNFNGSENLSNFITPLSGPAFSQNIWINKTKEVLVVNSSCWWSVPLKLYYIFKDPQFVENVSFDIYLRDPTKIQPNGDLNYRFWLEPWCEQDLKYEWSKRKYIACNGTNRYGKTLCDMPNATPKNMSLETWNHFSYNPLKWFGGSYNGRRRITKLGFMGYGAVKDRRLEIWLDNLTIVSVGKMYTDENGNFTINIPISEIGSGRHTITIISYDQYGSEAKVTKEIVI